MPRIIRPTAPQPPPAPLDPLYAEKRRLLSERARTAAIRRRRLEGGLIPLESAQGQMVSMCSAIRRALDLAPSHLPADLDPEARQAAAQALELAIAAALASIPQKCP
jgi:hypothetical protein